MSRYEIPKASDKVIKQSVMGFYRASDAGEAIDHDEAAEESESSGDVIRRQKKFLADIGILEKEGRSDYALTEDGRDLGRALTHERDDAARDKMREIFNSWQAVADIKDDLSSDYVSKEEVRNSIAFITENELDSTRLSAGANGLIDLLEWAEILETNEEGEYRVVKKTVDEAPSSSSSVESDKVEEEPELGEIERKEEAQVTNTNQCTEENQGTKPEFDHQTGSSSEMSSPNSLNINLELSGDEDPENVRELLLAIRMGLEQNINVNEHSLSTELDSTSEEGKEENENLNAFIEE